MAFHNLWNFREATLADTMAYDATDFTVMPGLGANFPPVPFIMTITLDYTLARLKQSERIEVTEVDSGDGDHFINCVRNFDNPLVPAGDVTTPGTEAREHIAGEKTAVFLCSYNIEELQTAVEDLQAQPYPDDIEGDTATLVNQIQVGDVKGAFADAAGMIKWAGGHFQGYTGSAWVDLDDTSGGGWTPPAGTDGQTLVYDTDDWYASSLIEAIATGITFTLDTNVWSFTADYTIIPNDLYAIDIFADSVNSPLGTFDYVQVESLSATDVNTNLTKAGAQVAFGYDTTGTTLGTPAGFLFAAIDLDLGAPPFTDFLSPLVIGGEPITLYSTSSVSINGVTAIGLYAPVISLGVSIDVSATEIEMKKPLYYKPQSSYPGSPQNGDMFYHTADGFRIYQAGSWYSFAAGAVTGWPAPGTKYGVIRYNPDTPDWEYTDELRIAPEGAYFEHAIIIKDRDPEMLEVAGLIEYRNNDFMGYLYDPNNDLIEVSLTNIATSQRFPKGVDTGIVDGDYIITDTVINLTGLTVEVTDGEYISFEGDDNLYQIVSHTPAAAPTQQITITPGLVVALTSGTTCNARSYRMLYFGLDQVWHSSQYARIVPNEETIGEDLMRVQSLQIGPYGQNGFEGTIRWNDTLSELQWHDGVSWNSWPVSSSIPSAVGLEGSIMSSDDTNWQFRDYFRVLDDGVVSDVSITTPVLILDDGGGTTRTLTPSLFELGDFTVDAGTIATLVATTASITTLTVGTLITEDPEDPEAPASLTGPRLDLRVNDTLDRDIFSFIATQNDLTLARNVSLLGEIVGPIAVGETVLAVTGFTSEVVDGNTLKIEGDNNTYIIASHTGLTEIVLEEPGLYEEAADAAIVSTASADTLLENIAVIDADGVNWDYPNFFTDATFSNHAVFNYTIQVGEEQFGVDEEPGMIRFNGDFQGRLDNGQWASFTLGLAGGDKSGQGYGTILYWNGTKWIQNTNARVSDDGSLLLAADTSSTPVAGAIKWNGSDFVGYKTSSWVSLTGAAGAPSLPTAVGYPNATLYWDETTVDWLINPNVTTDLSKLNTPLVELWDYASFSELGRIDHVGGYPIGTTVLDVDTFYGQVIDTNTLLIVGDSTVHTIVSHLPVSGPTTQVTIAGPGLVAAVADNATITIQEALVRPTPSGGQIRYNQNDYEGWMEDVGWVSFTGHVNYLPTREGDPLLDTGHLLKFNGAQWIAEHDARFFRDSFKLDLDLEVQGIAYFYETMFAESIKLGDKMPTSYVNTTGSEGKINTETQLPVGTTNIPVTDWVGPIYIGSVVKFFGDVTEYTVTALEPTIGDPTTITIATPGLEYVLDDLTPVSVTGVVEAQVPAPGTIYYNSGAQKFYGYNDDVWILLGSPIQGTPTENQVLRYEDPYWVPAADPSGASYFEVQDTQLYATIPLRLDDSSTEDGWLIEQNYIVQGETDRYALLIRGTDILAIDDPTWNDKDIWFEFCTGADVEVGPYCKINTDRVILIGIEGETLDISGIADIGGDLTVEGAVQFNSTLTVSDDIDLTSGDLIVRDGYVEVSDGIYGGFIHSYSHGYFDSYVRIGYAEGASNPIGSIRYSNPNQDAIGDWEGWDGEKWVSFTHVDISCLVAGAPVVGDMIRYSGINNRWEVSTAINIAEDLSDRTLPAIAITNSGVTIGAVTTDTIVYGLNIAAQSSALASGNASAYGVRVNDLSSHGIASSYAFASTGTVSGAAPSGVSIGGNINGITAAGIIINANITGSTFFGGGAYGLYIDPTFLDGTPQQAIHVETGDVEFMDDLSIGDDLYVGNDIDVTGNATIDGSTIIDGNLDVGIDLDVVGSVDIGVDLEVLGSGYIGVDLDVIGSVDIGVDLDVGGDLNVIGRVDISEGLNVDEELYVSGAFHIYHNSTETSLFYGNLWVDYDISSTNGDLLLESGHGVYVDGDQIITDQQPNIPLLGTVVLGTTGTAAAKYASVQTALNVLQAKIDALTTMLRVHGLIVTL